MKSASQIVGSSQSVRIYVGWQTQECQWFDRCMYHGRYKTFAGGDTGAGMPVRVGMPRRTAAGVDYNRVNLLMAVLEKNVGVRLADQDAYINAE